MAIDYSKLQNVTARDFVRALKRDGFVLSRKIGSSHQKYRHPVDKRRVTVSYHGHGSRFPTGTLKTMIERQAKWTEEDLKRLGLLK